MKTARVLIIMGLLAWACAEIDATNKSTSVNDQSPQWSELALLMRKMHEDAKLWRDSIASGMVSVSQKPIYEQMISATPTDSAVTGPVFESFALNYQNYLDSFLLANNVELSKIKYNNLITACIDCHQQYCPGPIKAIKKLYFPDV